MGVRPHVHLGVLAMAAMLLVGVLMAMLGPAIMRHQSAAPPTEEDRSDGKHRNNDASLQFFYGAGPGERSR